MKRWLEILMYAAVTLMIIEVILAAVMQEGKLSGAIMESLVCISCAGVATITQIYRCRTDQRTAIAFGLLFVMAAGSLLLALSAHL
jgi:hypothetical protein